MRAFLGAVVAAAMLLPFLPPRVAYAATIVVTSTADTMQCDANLCTLRGALILADLTTGVDSITFNIPGTGPTPPVIQPASHLPSILEGVVIEGTTQSQVQVVIDGSLAGAGPNGFVRLAASRPAIRGLGIQSFTANRVV